MAHPFRSCIDLRESSFISVDSGVKCHYNGAFLDSLSYFARKLLSKNADDPNDPYDVICDVTQSKKFKNKVRRHHSSIWQHLMCLMSSAYITYAAKQAISKFPHMLMMGEVTWLTRPQMICTKNLRYSKCEYPGLVAFWKFQLPWESPSLATLRSCGILWPRGGLLMTLYVSDLTWPENEKCL